jgi:hypothetical protein
MLTKDIYAFSFNAILYSLLISIVLGLIPALIAVRKGHNFFYWLLYGTFLLPIAIPHALLLKTKEKKQENTSPTDSGPAATKSSEASSKQ